MKLVLGLTASIQRRGEKLCSAGSQEFVGAVNGGCVVEVVLARNDAPRRFGPNLGLHCDQLAVPLPWGRNALTANTNWCLTEYTEEGGTLAYVPGSHRRMTPPTFPDAVRRAVPCEAPKGSLLVFHGATWHGAFPRRTPGMRLSIANYYRHLMILPQEEFRNSFDRSLADDSDDPALFRMLCGFDDVFPYVEQSERVPRVIDS